MRIKLMILCMALCCLCFNAFAQNVPDYVPTDGVVGWYDFDGDVSDASDNAHNGSVFGASFAESPLNGAVSFDGTDDYLEIPTSSVFEDMVHELTLSAWFKKTNSNTGTIVAKRNFVGNPCGERHHFELTCFPDNSVFFSASHNCIELNNTQVQSTPGIFELNEWTHVSVTYDNGALLIYVNGDLVLEFDEGYRELLPNDHWINFGRIHRSGGTPFFNEFAGDIDESGIWNRVLTSEEILALYNTEPTLPGCIDPTACNYDSSAPEDDGSCEYSAYGQNCDGSCLGGTSWFVNGMAEANEANGDSLTPFSTIQAACDAACSGDTILIAPGTYMENVSLTTQGVAVMGYSPTVHPDSVAAQVIIDGAELGTTFYISGAQTVLSDLTIQNGRAGYGAGLYMSGCDGSLVHRCIIRDNVGTGDITAHGIQLGANNCIIEDCLVTGNYGRKHTVNTGGSNNIIRNCRIIDNNAWETGGGIVVYTSNMLIENCLIANNNNGGVTTYKDDTVIDHCTISDNTNFGCFIWCYSNDADFYISNSVIANNGSAEFKMVQTGDKVATAHLRNALVEGGVDYDWLSVYKQFDVDSSLISLAPSFQMNYELASNSAGIGQGSNFRYGFDGILSVASSALDLNFEDRPIPVGSSADLGCFEHPLGTPEPTLGCTNVEACNYDSAATDDDGSCILPTCDDPTACNFDENAVCGGGSCVLSGCMEIEACNYNALAECEGETCEYSCCPGPGCCAEGTVWDYALAQCIPFDFCQEDLDGDGVIGINDLMQLLASFGTTCEEPETSGFSCGGPVNFHGYDYATVQIGEQCWFAENLRTELYANGDPIPSDIQDSLLWATAGAQTYFLEDSVYLEERGRMYNGHAVLDARGLCPTGWHVSSDSDFIQLEGATGMSEVDWESTAGDRGCSLEIGKAWKSQTGWYPGDEGTDLWGLSVQPSGYFLAWEGFGNAYINSEFWTSTPYDATQLWRRQVPADSGCLFRGWWEVSVGSAIRCVEDTEE